MTHAAPPLDDDSSMTRPSRARFIVLGFLCTLALLLYVDRVCIGQAASSISKDLHLSESQIGWVFFAFSLAYTIFEVPTGHWGDRHGSRGVITRVVAFWSVFTALTGAALGLWSLLVIRFLFGAGEAGAYPNAARVVTRWFPQRERGKARGAITSVSLMGGTVAPILSACLIHTIGWRWMFSAFGVVGVVWAILFYRWFRDDPAAHPGVNSLELSRIQPPADPAAAAPLAHDPIPWGKVFASANTWLLGAIMGVSATLFYMLFQWYPTYLKQVRGQSEIGSGWLTSCVMLGGAAGCLAGGWVADAVSRGGHSRKWNWRLCGAAALTIAAVCMASVRMTDSMLVITFCNALALFFMQMQMPIWWSVVAEISGRHGAAMWGLMNSMAGLATMGGAKFVGNFVEARRIAGFSPEACWGPVFDVVGICLFAGAMCWLLVDSTYSIVKHEED